MRAVTLVSTDINHRASQRYKYESELVSGPSSRHAGSVLVRTTSSFSSTMTESTKLSLTNGNHTKGFRKMFPDKSLSVDFLRLVLKHVLLALDFLHIEAKVIHTGGSRSPSFRVYATSPWTEKVDVWNIGVLIWDMFEYGNLFKTTGGVENKEDNIYHLYRLVHMIALLGPPSKDFLERSQTDRPWQWFDREAGNWNEAVEIPSMSLEDAERKLKGEDKTRFLRFIRRMLKGA